MGLAREPRRERLISPATFAPTAANGPATAATTSPATAAHALDPNLPTLPTLPTVSLLAEALGGDAGTLAARVSKG